MTTLGTVPVIGNISENACTLTSIIWSIKCILAMEHIKKINEKGGSQGKVDTD